MSTINTGQFKKGEHISKITEFTKGFTPWNRGLKLGKNFEHSKRMTGRKHSAEQIEKIRLASIGRVVSKETREKVSGKNNWNWKGGITPINIALRMSFEYEEWRSQVFERDLYTCQNCKIVGGYLHADHIKPFALFPELRFEVSNGRALCVPCHYKITFGKLMPDSANKWAHNSGRGIGK